ncbi:PREDICTED: rhophilin-1 [Bison bison bison]|uniref:Rhophilin-1 n=1 Tax=Bison bison bison TaxID=43346 RepID=A0A6P3GT79_BISBB|nr:PREDICTED: rhophilin-1 [Bison bison bison]
MATAYALVFLPLVCGEPRGGPAARRVEPRLPLGPALRLVFPFSAGRRLPGATAFPGGSAAVSGQGLASRTTSLMLWLASAAVRRSRRGRRLGSRKVGVLPHMRELADPFTRCGNGGLLEGRLPVSSSHSLLHQVGTGDEDLPRVPQKAVIQVRTYFLRFVQDSSHCREAALALHVCAFRPVASLQGCDLSTDSLHGRLQSRRARIHQQIDRELRMRTGAENLYRATSNARVRETVALELSDVNSSLQLLKEELAGLDSSGDTGQPESEGVTAPMIPLGLKETKPLDWAPPLKVSGSLGLALRGFLVSSLTELTSIWQATRTPSRSKAGLELLTAYYNQLCFLEARFVTPARSLGLLFHWYDSLTGLPAQQRALAFEKGSVLFNIGALHTQIGARQNRSCPEGIGRAVEAFQRAAGAFSLLRENFSHAPSLDMSPASLSMLEQLMRAQAQECVFEGLLLQAPRAAHDCLAQLRLAQEAAQVAAEYRLVRRTMAQPPVRGYAPFPWITLVHVKAEHFHALAHYHAALGLCDGASVAESELPVLEKVFLSSAEARGPALPQEREERSKLGKAHLRRALLGQEAALQLHAVCRALRREDLLQAVLAQALQRSLAKYSELDLEDDFHEATEAPDIQPKTQQRPEGRTPSFSRVKVADIFHRLGPLSVFSAKNHWRLVGPVHLSRGEGGFGFTLRGDSPVLIAAVVPGGRAAEAGLKEGDYIVSVNGQPCRWWKHAELVAQLKGVGDEGVSLQVVTLLPAAELPVSGDRRPALGGLLRSQKECGQETPVPSRGSPRPRPLLGWNRKANRGKTGRRLSPAPQP